MASSADHTRLLKATLLALGEKCGDKGRFFRMETGLALNPRTEQPFEYGIVGQGDIMGIVRPGRHVWFECKTGDAVQSKRQKNFQAMIERFGGVYAVIRSPSEAVKIVEGL